MLATMMSATAGAAASASRARLRASTPITETGITLISRKITSRRVRTGSRGAPRTSVSPPSGKNRGNQRRHCRSATKNMNAVAAEPAMTVMPNTERSAWASSNLPVNTGHRTPQIRPARVQPARWMPAMTHGSCTARRRMSSPAGPGGAVPAARGRDHRWPSQ